jgi:pyruvate/2-oxoglutarate dehydrogenase complex dihydrolipoamide dehydrogenase (E3) component
MTEPRWPGGSAMAEYAAQRLANPMPSITSSSGRPKFARTRAPISQAHEGKVAAEAAAGQPSFFDGRVIPSVACTDPEVAWVGLTEGEARARGVRCGKGVFPWAASGRSLSLGRDEGLTTLLFDAETRRVIGCGIVGPRRGRPDL